MDIYCLEVHILQLVCHKAAFYLMNKGAFWIELIQWYYKIGIVDNFFISQKEKKGLFPVGEFETETYNF